MEYYIASIKQKEALPIVLDHMRAIGTLVEETCPEHSDQDITWYGTKIGGELKGVLGLMFFEDRPDDLIIVSINGDIRSIKLLLGYVLALPQKNKIGYIDIYNSRCIEACAKRGFKVSPMIEQDDRGNRFRCVQLTTAGG
jgi:hypothetical protein